jgi:hypothetical protein
MVDRQVLKDRTPRGCAQRMRLLDAQRIHQRDHVIGDMLGRIPVRAGPVAVAGTAMIEGDAAVAVRKDLPLVIPGVHDSDKAGNEDEGGRHPFRQH